MTGHTGIEGRVDGIEPVRVGFLALITAFALTLLIPTFASAATTRPQVGSAITGSSIGVTLKYPYGIGVDESTGNIFVADGSLSLVAILGAEGGLPTGVASPYRITGFSFGKEPSAVAVDNVASSPSKGAVYVTDVNRSKVKKHTLNSGTQKYELAGELTPTGEDTKLDETVGVAIDAEGNVFAVDYANSAVVKFSPTGTQLARFNVISGPANLALDTAGDLFIAEYHNECCGGQAFKLPSNGAGGFESSIEIPLEKGGQPLADSIAIDMARNQLFVSLTDRVLQLNATTLAKEGEFGVGVLEKATGIAVNSKANRVYVSDVGTTKRVLVFGAEVPVPTATAEAASAITPIAATLNGTVNPTGTAVTECQFEYLTDAAYKANDPTASLIDKDKGKFNGPNAPAVKPCEGSLPADSVDHPVTAALTGLEPSTTYHFRIKTTNANGSYVSRKVSFVTPSPVSTEPATGVTGTGATLNGSVKPFGLSVTECKFEYGPDTSYGSSAPCEGAIPADEGTHPVSAAISGLAPNTTYHFRLSANVNGETLTGGDASFGLVKNVFTLPATGVGAESATLNGEVNPDGVSLDECVFEYGETTAYGQSAPCVPDAAGVGSGTSLVPVSATIALHPGTAYHFRLRVDSANGLALGEDETLQTLGPVVRATWAEDVVRSEATIAALINPQGAATTYRFEWGTTDSYGDSSPELEVGSDSTDHTVAQILEDLAPGTTYHYRVVTTSSVATNEGPDRTFTTYEPLMADTECPNQAFRTGPSANLPDCRAYEMVSPVDKSGGDIFALPEAGSGLPSVLEQASLSGGRIAYGSYRAFGDAQSAAFTTQYLAARSSEEGWQNHAINPPATRLVFGFSKWDSEFRAFSDDLCFGWITPFFEPILAEDALSGYPNLYRRQDRLCGAEGYVALTNAQPEKTTKAAFNKEVQGFSADGQVTAWVASDSLAGSGAPAQPPNCGLVPGACRASLYVQAAGGQPRFACVLPGGAPSLDSCSGGAGGATLGSHKQASLNGALSADGAHVFWTASASGDGKIYLRLNPLADEPECTGPGSPCTIAVSEDAETLSQTTSSRFRMAASDGSRAIFTSGGDLYEFETATEATQKVAGGVSGLLGASADATRVYFVSTEAISGSGENSEGIEAEAGQPNLYIHQTGPGSGINRFIARLAQRDDSTSSSRGTSSATHPVPIFHNSRVSPDGLHAAFMSQAPLTGYDNTDVTSPVVCGEVGGTCDNEVFLYDATVDGGEGELLCASCDPSGARPKGVDVVPGAESFWVSGRLPTFETPLHGPRVLAEDGSRLFFESADALTLSDTNGHFDVYQWERPGAGSCDASDASFSPEAGGCIELISSGHGKGDARIVDAGTDGRDIFFTTVSSLTPQDPGLIDIYDARVDGGFAEPAAPPAACEGEACQSPPEAPNDPTPASSAFEGAGNVVESASKPRCKQGKVRRKGRCVKKGKRKAVQRRANHDRRTAR